jgi:opacity protein-like surface antigen
MVSAQEFSTNPFKVLNSGTTSKSTIIALVDQETFNNPSLVFNQKQLKSHNTSAYLFINTISLESLYTELNQLAKSNTSTIGFNRYALQLIIIGTQNELERYQSLNIKYFSSHWFLLLDNSKANQPFTTVRKADWNCEEYLKNIKGKYIWEIDKAKLPSKDTLINHEEGRLTIGYRPVMNFGLNNNNLGNYFSNGLSLDYQISKKIQLYAAGSFAIKRPKIEKEIEKQIRSQIDISGVMNGTVTEQYVTLSVPIKSQVYTSFTLGLRYLFTPKKDFSFYGTTALSSFNSTKTTGQLDSTLTISFNGTTPNNNFNSGNVDDEAIGLVEREAVTINSSIGAGFQYKLSGHWRVDLSLNYSTSIRNVRSTDTFNNNAFNIAFGFNYRFKDKKEYEKIHFY